MSTNSEKTREQILAERQEKKKKKAALKNQPKDKNKIGQSNNEGGKLKKNDSAQNSLEASREPGEFKQAGGGQQVIDNKSGINKNSVFLSSANAVNSSKENVARKSDTFEKNYSEENVARKSDTFEKNIHGELSSTQENNSVKNSQVVNNDSNKDDAPKTKAQLKAERRAKQEAQRERKLQMSVKGLDKKVCIPSKPHQTTAKVVKPVPEVSHKVKLFAHLYDIPHGSDAVDGLICIHPSIVKLKAQFSSRVVSGANACCLALLNALKKVVMDFETPQNQEFSRGLESEITKCMSYLSKQGPATVSMANAVKHLKFKINQSRGNDLECKNSISEWIDTYIKEQLEMAAKAICLFVREKITCGDVILTYGWSSLILQILTSAFNEGIKFEVIVADGRPWLDGRELLKKLVCAGIRCTYVFVNGLSFVMPEVTKILLGAHALLANGYVMSQVGSSQIALLAKTYNVPVLVCCETHKFSERVQTDSFVYNELGNPDNLVSSKGCLSKELSKWKTIPSLTPLNLMYDVTPPDLVSAVVTEIAVLPCTSVPVILRIKPPDLAF